MGAMALLFNIEDFDEYIRQGEPDKKEKAYIWQTAIGLQAVDGKQILAHTGYGRMEKDNLDWTSLQAQDKYRTSSGQVR